MRIDPQIPAPENTGTSRVTDAAAGSTKSSSRSAAPEPNDTVHLSAGQATVRNLISQLGQVPDTRERQVSALRTEVQSGKFTRSDAAVAGAIVAQLFSAKL